MQTFCCHAYLLTLTCTPNMYFRCPCRAPACNAFALVLVNEQLPEETLQSVSLCMWTD